MKLKNLLFIFSFLLPGLAFAEICSDELDHQDLEGVFQQAGRSSFEDLSARARVESLQFLQMQIQRLEDELDSTPQASPAGWQGSARRFERDLKNKSLAGLFEARDRILELDDQNLPVPVIRNLAEVGEFLSGNLPGASNIELRLVSLVSKPEPEAQRLANTVEAALRVAEAMPFDASASEEEVDFILKALTNARSVNAYLKEQRNREVSVSDARSRINLALQKMYWVRAILKEKEDKAYRERQEGFVAKEPGDPNRFFDASRYPREAAFLQAIGARPLESFPETVDLSEQFKRPVHQCLNDGTPTYACTAFAIVSDMETHPGVPSLSKGYLYGLAVANHSFYEQIVESLQRDYERLESELQQEARRQRWSAERLQKEISDRIISDPVNHQRWLLTQTGYAEMAQIPLPADTPEKLEKILGKENFEKAVKGQLSGTIPPVVLHLLQHHPVPKESEFPWPNIIPGSYENTPRSGFRIKAFATTQTEEDDRQQKEPPQGVRDFDFYRLILANGIPLSFSYNTDARYTIENWMYPVDMTEKSAIGGHIINVVGYGVEKDPQTGLSTPYLLVRDSLQKEPIHWRSPAHEILPRAYSVHRVTAVEPVE